MTFDRVVTLVSLACSVAAIADKFERVGKKLHEWYNRPTELSISIEANNIRREAEFRIAMDQVERDLRSLGYEPRHDGKE